jgi:hypothetical protein
VLRHLFVANEVTSVVLLTVHNLTYFLSLMRGAREAIMAGRYMRFRAAVELRPHRGGKRRRGTPQLTRGESMEGQPGVQPPVDVRACSC